MKQQQKVLSLYVTPLTLGFISKSHGMPECNTYLTKYLTPDVARVKFSSSSPPGRPALCLRMERCCQILWYFIAEYTFESQKITFFENLLDIVQRQIKAAMRCRFISNSMRLMRRCIGRNLATMAVIVSSAAHRPLIFKIYGRIGDWFRPQVGKHLREIFSSITSLVFVALQIRNTCASIRLQFTRVLIYQIWPLNPIYWFSSEFRDCKIYDVKSDLLLSIFRC